MRQGQNIKINNMPVFALLAFQAEEITCCLSKSSAWAFAILASWATELLIYVITMYYVSSLNWGSQRNPHVTFQAGESICTDIQFLI